MGGLSKLGLKLGATAALVWAAGCVPISDYRKLEQRFVEQEQYVVAHRKEMRERERREQVLTLRAREQERQMDLLRARLQKSERLRQRLADRVKTMSVEASAPRAEPTPQPQPQPLTVAGLEVNAETGGIVLESGVLFAPGQATLKTSGKSCLDGLIAELKKTYPDKKVRVEGHTDTTPIKRSKHESNWALSAKRALAVLHYLESKGIASSQLSFAGYGPHKPIESGQGKKALARNRRVEVLLVD